MTLEGGQPAYRLRKRIQEIRREIDSFGDFEERPELIKSANLLRANEYLGKKSTKQAELAATYAEYSKILEDLLSAVFEIQDDLKEILKEQSLMLSRQKKKPKGHSGTVRHGQRRQK